MDYSLWIGGHLIPSERVGLPGRFRVGFRGPGPATREAGIVQLKIDDRDGYWQHSSERIELGQEVWIDRGGQRIFLGAVSYKEVDLKRNWIFLQAKELSSLLKDCKGGIRNLAGLENPELYVWGSEWQIAGLPGGSCLHVFLEEYIDELMSEGWAPLEKMWIFTNFQWDLDWFHHGAFKLWWTVPKSLKEILDEVVLQFRAQKRQNLVVASLILEGPSWEGQFVVRRIDDSFLRVRPDLGDVGLFRQGDHIFCYGTQGTDVYVDQILNRGIAIHLQKIELFQDPLFIPFINAVYDRPRRVTNTRDNEILAFFMMYSVRIEYTTHLHEAAFIAYIDLKEVGDVQISGGGTMPVHYIYREWVCPDDFPQRSILLTPDLWFEPSTNAAPEAEHVLPTKGGSYRIAAPEMTTVAFRGNLLLDEMVYDFRNATLGQILNELAFVTGCDWWVNSHGWIYFERIDGQLENGSILGQVLEESEIEEEIKDEEFETNVSGIIMSPTHKEFLAQAWGSKRRESGKRKRLKVMVPNEIGVELGQRIEIEGARRGILEAMEFEKEKVIFETRI